MSDPNLVTTCNFNGREYLIKMHVDNKILELIVTDKQTGEDWQCCYDASYIESITQKTGNFKQFTIFTAMLKSGLLKTSNCVYLELMSFEDLDALRHHRIRGSYTSYQFAQSNNNRRYLILTYTVEFDRIHYPLPLEYCGPPDPKILQQTINKLEEEIVQLKDQTKGSNSNRVNSKTIIQLQKRVEELLEENHQLRNENLKLTQVIETKSKNKNYINMLQDAIKSLEKSVLSERKSHHQLVEKLRKDKQLLCRENDRLRKSEKKMFNKLQNNTPRTRNLDSGRISRTPSPRNFERWESPTRGGRRSRQVTPKKTENYNRQPSSRNIDFETRQFRQTIHTKNEFRGRGDSRSPSPKNVHLESWELREQPRSRQIRSLRTKLRNSNHLSESESSSKDHHNVRKSLINQSQSAQTLYPRQSASVSSGEYSSTSQKATHISRKLKSSSVSSPIETKVLTKLNEAFTKLEREVNMLSSKGMNQRYGSPTRTVSYLSSGGNMSLDGKVGDLRKLVHNILHTL